MAPTSMFKAALLAARTRTYLMGCFHRVLTKPVLERCIREALVLAKERAQSISGYEAEVTSRQRRQPEHTASCGSGPSHHITTSTSSTLVNNTAAS